MQDIAKKLSSFRFDIKAETVINELLTKGYSLKDIIIEYKSCHKKNWANDILNCESRGGKLFFELSRDGLFDALPEYLFLKPTDNHRLTKGELEKNIEFNIRQRINAHILFNPIEFSIFEKRIDLERFENEITSLLNGYCFDSLSAFFKIDDKLEPVFRSKLTKLVPLVYSIAGDMPLTAICLEYFLEVPVAYEIVEVPRQVSLPGNPNSGGLGSGVCGDDMLVNGDIIDAVPTILFSIGPVEGKEVPEYLKGGRKRTFIDYFSDYFIPLEYDIDLVIEVNSKDSAFFLNDSFLGFNASTN